MRIKEITSQTRRDFWAVYVCEHCGREEKSYGYDDEHFHQNVIPKMACKSCGKVAPENYQPAETRYPAGQVV
jgi:protein-arginine kinase activator protein McsA